MADFTAPAPNAGSVQEGTLPVKAAIVLALAVLADWLFYGHGIGISATIFAAALACGSLLANLATLNRRQVLPAGALLLVALVPAVEEFNVASLTFMVLALGIGACFTARIEGILRLVTLDFMPRAGFDLILRRDILIPYLVFRPRTCSS